MNETQVERSKRMERAISISDAIDRVLWWVGHVLGIAFLGAFSFWLGRSSWDNLPIDWDGSISMWGDLWMIAHAVIVFPALIICLVVSLLVDLISRTSDRHFDRMKNEQVYVSGQYLPGEFVPKSAEEIAMGKAIGRIYLVLVVTFFMGLNGLLDFHSSPDRPMAITPWLSVPLMVLSGLGFVFLVRVRNLAERVQSDLDRACAAKPSKRRDLIEHGEGDDTKMSRKPVLQIHRYPILAALLAVGGVLLIGPFLVLTSFNNQASRPKAEHSMTEAAPAETRRILEAFRQGPDFDGLSEVPALELPVIENPGQQKDIDATLVYSVERSPIGTEHDGYRQFLQTLPMCSRYSADCWGPESRRVFQALAELPSTAVWFASENGRTFVIRSWIRGDVRIVLIGRFSQGLQEATIAQLILPLGAGGLTFGTEDSYSPGFLFLSELSDGSLLLSLDSGSRCNRGERRRSGVMLRLSPSLKEFVWASPLRVSGGNTFAYNEARIFAVDGGSCETDYLYELDLDTGAVVSRTRVPSGQDAGDFVALDGNNLYLVLYNRFMHYRLN